MSNKPAAINRIRILPGASPHERRYCVTTPLARRTSNVTVTGYFTEEYFKELKQQHGLHKDVFGFVNYIYKELDRVIELRFGRFQITVIKASVFDWDEVDRWVLSAIRSSFFAEDAFDKVEVQDWTKEAETARVPGNSKAR
jgi:hypothetical protein